MSSLRWHQLEQGDILLDKNDLKRTFVLLSKNDKKFTWLACATMEITVDNEIDYWQSDMIFSNYVIIRAKNYEVQ
jgi:hypothetical protein